MGEKESSGAWARVRENSTELITGLSGHERARDEVHGARRHDELEGRQGGADT